MLMKESKEKYERAYTNLFIKKEKLWDSGETIDWELPQTMESQAQELLQNKTEAFKAMLPIVRMNSLIDLGNERS